MRAEPVQQYAATITAAIRSQVLDVTRERLESLSADLARLGALSGSLGDRMTELETKWMSASRHTQAHLARLDARSRAVEARMTDLEDTRTALLDNLIKRLDRLAAEGVLLDRRIAALERKRDPPHRSPFSPTAPAHAVHFVEPFPVVASISEGGLPPR